MLLGIKTEHFNFTFIIWLNNKSSPQFIRLNGTKCRLSEVIVHLWILEGQGKPFFCRSATRTFLRICWLIIYRNVAILLPSLSWLNLDARGLLARQRRGASERVVLVGERPLARAVRSFERADPIIGSISAALSCLVIEPNPITLPVISPESRFDPGNLIGRSEKRFLEGLLLVKCATILSKPVLQPFP